MTYQEAMAQTIQSIAIDVAYARLQLEDAHQSYMHPAIDDRLVGALDALARIEGHCRMQEVGIVSCDCPSNPCPKHSGTYTHDKAASFGS